MGTLRDLRATWGYEFGASNLECFSWMFDGMFQKFQGCEFSPEMLCTPKNDHLMNMFGKMVTDCQI